MARKLKTFTTSAGFFDLAIAAPSMKAALEAWGATRNLFHQGFAKVSEEPRIVEATMAKPGVVLRRPVGTTGAFSENAELPSHLALGAGRRPPSKRPKIDRSAAKPMDETKARAASAAFDREQKRRQAKERKAEAARARQQERQDRTIAAAQAALDAATRDHQAKVEEIEEARATLDRKFEAEEARWKKREGELEGALRRARSPSHLRLVK
jgi:colicin import membrane protein